MSGKKFHSACCCDDIDGGGSADSSVYLRFSGLKARFRSVSTYLVHFCTALGLVMKGIASSPFLWISAPFLTHRFTSVTPDISFPCVPPKIATLRASSKLTLPFREDMAGLAFQEPRRLWQRGPAVSDRSKKFPAGATSASLFKCSPTWCAYVTYPRACYGRSL